MPKISPMVEPSFTVARSSGRRSYPTRLGCSVSSTDFCFHFPRCDYSCYPRGEIASAGVVERRVTMGLQFGIFDHIEPVPGQTLTQIYRDRLQLLERYDAAGFYAYHLAEHHTPAGHR